MSSVLEERMKEYKYMDYSLFDYLLKLVLPFSALGVLTFCAGLIFSEFLGRIRFLLYTLSVLFVGVGFLYPKIWASSKSKELEQNLHLFITHLGVLAATGIERVELFRVMSEKEEEYGPLSEVAKKINILLTGWNQSLDEACRYVAERTPSKIISDFLERMAHSAEAGRDVKEFVWEEQEVIISDYESMYDDSLNSLMDIRDLFISVMLAIVFLVVFSVLIPPITGISPLFLLGVAILVFLASEIGFFLSAEFILPDDPVFCKTDYFTSRDKKIRIGEISCVVCFVGISVFAALQLFFQTPFKFNPLPITAYVGLIPAPLVLPGIMLWLEEKKTKDRDEQFPSFIRSLGSVSSAKQTTASEVLRELKKKEFSNLTENIQNLYKRLKTRIDRKLAWDLFSSESGSFLIRKFGDMYYEGIENGGDPKEISEIISNNFKTVLRIRRKRYTKGNSILGLLYGMTAGVTVTVFIGFSLVIKMIDVMGSSLTGRMSEIFALGVYDVPGVRFMLLVMIVLNALISALFIRSVKDSPELKTFAHFGILIWIGIIFGKLAEIGLDVFINL